MAHFILLENHTSNLRRTVDENLIDLTLLKLLWIEINACSKTNDILTTYAHQCHRYRQHETETFEQVVLSKNYLVVIKLPLQDPG